MSDSEFPHMANDDSARTDHLVVPYPSLPTLHSAHLELLRRHREQGATAELLSATDDFIQRGSATGVLLDSEADRETAQGLVDYWSTIVLRTGHEPPDATLVDFDADLAPEIPDALCPYVGLDSFREANSGAFYGRQRLIDELVARLGVSRLLAVIGPSGSGKSSVVRAGVIPALRAGKLPGSENWHDFPPMVPGSDPLRSLAHVVRPNTTTGEWETAQVGAFQADAGHLAQLLANLGISTAVFVIDQFEEVFTLTEEEAARRAFIDNLLHVISLPNTEHRVILTMRSDFEPFVAREPELQAYFVEGRLPVTPLSAAELRDAIEKPALVVGLKFEDGVVDALLQDLLGEPAALPLLQFTLLKLWENRERNRVTMDTYRRLGGGRLALARSADEFYSALIPEEQVTARRILLRMVRPGEGLEVTSNRVRRAALYQGGEDPGRVDRVLEKLIASHLVRVTGGDALQDEQIEVAHEALVRNWPTLVDWLEDERASLATRRRLEAKAAEWVRLGRGASGLLDREQLLEAEHWLASPEAAYLGFDPALPELAIYSRAAIEEAEHEQEAARQRELEQARALAEAERQRAEAESKRAEVEERTNRRLRRMFRVLAIMAIITAGAAILAFSQLARAISEQQAADVARGEAVAARSTVEAQNGTLQAAVAEASNARATAQAGAETAVASAQQARAAQIAADQAREDAAVKQRSDGANLLAAVSKAVTVSKPQLSLLLGIEALNITQSAGEPSTPASTRAITETLINIGAPTIGLPGGGRRITSVALSSDGNLMLVGGADGSVRLWNLSGDVPSPNAVALNGTSTTINSVAITPDASKFIAADDSGTIYIWNAADPSATPRTLTGPQAPIIKLRISGNGDRLGVVGTASVAYVWNLRNLDAAPAQLAGQSQPITDLGFSQNGQIALTVGADGVGQLFNLSSSNPGRRSGFLNPRAPLTAAALSPNGQWAATAGEDGTIHVWTVNLARVSFNSGPRVLNAGGLTAMAIDPKNRWLVTGEGSGLVRLWRLGDTKPQFVLAGHTGGITALAFSADGHWLVTASADNTARVWDLSGANPAVGPRVLRAHEGKINAAALSGDGGRLASGGDDGVAREWNLGAPPPVAGSVRADEASLVQQACGSAGRTLTEAEWSQYFEGRSYKPTCAPSG